MATAIDTLATYDAIAASGLDEKAARAISKAIGDSAVAYRADLATKADITEVKSDLARLEAKLEAKIDSGNGVLRELIATTQNKMLIWMFGMLVTFSGIIIGFIKLT